MIHGLIFERTARRDDVVREVSRTWSNKQVAGGFILSVPYTVTATNDNGKPIHDRARRALPARDAGHRWTARARVPSSQPVRGDGLHRPPRP